MRTLPTGLYAPRLANGIPAGQSSSSPMKSVSGAGSTSLLWATHTKRVGKRKMPGISAATRPPTITMAKGRWESGPPDSFDGLPGAPVGRLIPHNQVVALFALQHLSPRLSAHGGLDRVLDVRYIHSVAGCARAVHYKLQVRLADHPKKAKVGDARDRSHRAADLFPPGIPC